ncbi:hypothetical protein EC973_008907 [Apophysomyces ossiformis]|uniref:RRM domain-containing protein n=1 Tax=Apophysomyces ossiformis TaxID=679940 RepID=A0A8H7BMM6_9FUNG|nr:hypothetical protein EC973_008907 [Apophysomyces ossiformis]
MWYAKEYDPIQAGSIDGTDTVPHDAAHLIVSHLTDLYSVDRPAKRFNTDPAKTIFVGRLNFDTTEETLCHVFEQYGHIKHTQVIRNLVTGTSQGYAFITFEDARAAREAYERAHESVLDDHVLLVDYERSRLMPGWIPRRFGGGFGGKKESGQLRFGARDRPFRRPMWVTFLFLSNDTNPVDQKKPTQIRT